MNIISSRCLSSQRYNFLKANHNIQDIPASAEYVVYQVKDTIFWKQITTTKPSGKPTLALFIKSKIQFFESKSQLLQNWSMLLQVVYQVKDTIFWKQITTVTELINVTTGCLSSQRYNFLKANHNTLLSIILAMVVVYQVKDTIFWKQITTFYLWQNHNARLFIKSKIQFSESKSQLLISISNKSGCCLSSQRYNFLKANHNTWHIFIKCHTVVYQVKDTIFWKQITTRRFFASKMELLFIKSKIQFFESKSQQKPSVAPSWTCCLSSQRYNFLKANHNNT